MKRIVTVKATLPETQYPADILSGRLSERGIRIAPGGYLITLQIAEGLEDGAFRITDENDGLEIAAGGMLGLIHGVGWFLHGSRFCDGNLIPGEYRGTQTPACSIRGMYFASHFHNYYHMASSGEMRRYMEDLALWGVNYIMLCYPMIDIPSMDDPESVLELKRHTELFGIAHSLGMKAAEILSVNSGFCDFPREWSAAKNNDPYVRRGDHGNMMCLSIPGVQELVDTYNEFVCTGLKSSGVDMFCVWPYDEGGCGCEDCAPWGVKGYLKGSKRAFEIARQHFPCADRLVSTWCFDTPYEGEWEALDRSLENGKWCDVILADSHEDYPRYPLDVHVPGDLPLINFPEISMWGLFPWGGWGATMLPERFSRLFEQTEGKLSGGFPYSEGIYEDINKVVVSQMYWTGKTDWKETLRRYARYEFGLENAEEFLSLVFLLEKTHTDVAEGKDVALEEAEEAYRLAREIDSLLPKWSKRSWRWRIIYLRALIDSRRYRIALESCRTKLAVGNEHGAKSTDWKALLRDDAPVQEAFRELISLFHCSERERDDIYHCRVRPMCE